MGPILFNNQRGITLVELLVVLVLFGLILNLGFLFFGFGNTLFVQGESKATIQQNMRLAMNMIVREVRFASQVVILETIPEEFHFYGDEILLFINAHGQMEFRSQDQVRFFSDTLLNQTSLTLFFEQESHDLLSMTMGNTRDSQTINTQVKVLNGDVSPDSETDSQTGVGIRLFKGE